MAPADTILLQSILDRIGTLDAKVDHIAEKQAVIAERVDTHIKASETPAKSVVGTVFGVLKTWVLPIVLAIFLLGRQSVEYSAKQHEYPPKSTFTSLQDDTFVQNRNKKIDSILISQIMKGMKRP